jgi:uncharacterized protein YndB with AHSA1/START domain
MSGAFVRRTLDATPERVFAAFADAALVARWLRPSADVQLTVLAFDFRIGGAYRFAYDVPDVGRMIVGGTYRVIERPSRIEFSWVIEPPDVHAGIDSAVTVTFSEIGSRTELVIRHEQWDRADADERHGAGWCGALDLLAPLLRAAQKETTR